MDENQILNLLNDGYDSGIDTPAGDDDLRGYLETLREEEELRTREVDDEGFIFVFHDQRLMHDQKVTIFFKIFSIYTYLAYLVYLVYLSI